MTTDDPPTVDVGEATPKTASEYKCPGCGREWDRHEWEKNEERSWSTRYGGDTYYNCPQDGCDGLAVTHW